MGTRTGTELQSFEQLAQEIEALDTYWGPMFRSIIEDGRDQKFLDHLEQGIRGHDRDIEKLCNAHYQGFIDSILKFQNVCSEAQYLKGRISYMGNEIQVEIANVLQRGKDVAKTSKIEYNIIFTIEQLEICLPVFKMYQKLKEQLTQKQYLI